MVLTHSTRSPRHPTDRSLKMVLARLPDNPATRTLARSPGCANTRSPDRSKMALALPTRHPIYQSTRPPENGPHPPDSITSTPDPIDPITDRSKMVITRSSGPTPDHSPDFPINPISQSLKNGPHPPDSITSTPDTTPDFPIARKWSSLTRHPITPTSRPPDFPIAQKWSSLTRNPARSPDFPIAEK